MNVTTITMPKEEAQAKLEAYRAQNQKRTDEEYQAAEAGYAALAEGTPLISLSEAIRAAPLDEKGRPRLAFARADRRQVKVSWPTGSRQLSFDATANMRYWSGAHGTLVIFIDMERPSQHYAAGYSLVPMVPADVRPSGHLKNYFILWEVMQWADREISSKPDRDPYLLKHIGGDLYAVLAEWDLTELERLVMAGRRDG